MQASGPPSGVLRARGIRGSEQELALMPLWTGWRTPTWTGRGSARDTVCREPWPPWPLAVCPQLSAWGHWSAVRWPNKKLGVQQRGDELEPARLLSVCWPPSPITNFREQCSLPLLLLPFPKSHARNGTLREEDGGEKI